MGKFVDDPLKRHRKERNAFWGGEKKKKGERSPARGEEGYCFLSSKKKGSTLHLLTDLIYRKRKEKKKETPEERERFQAPQEKKKIRKVQNQKKGEGRTVFCEERGEKKGDSL